MKVSVEERKLNKKKEKLNKFFFSFYNTYGKLLCRVKNKISYHMYHIGPS